MDVTIVEAANMLGVPPVRLYKQRSRGEGAGAVFKKKVNRIFIADFAEVKEAFDNFEMTKKWHVKAENPRPNKFKVCLSDSEAKKLNYHAGDIPRSVYIRDALLEKWRNDP